MTDIESKAKSNHPGLASRAKSGRLRDMKWKSRKTILLFIFFVTTIVFWFAVLSRRGVSVAEFEKRQSGLTFTSDVIELLGPPTYQRDLTSGSGTYFEWELSDGYVYAFDWPFNKVKATKEDVLTNFKRRIYRRCGWAY